jgi:hypothetical protein
MSTDLQREYDTLKRQLEEADAEVKRLRGVVVQVSKIAVEAATSRNGGTPDIEQWVELEKVKADAYEDAARQVEKIAEDYTHEHGSYDPSTNAWELHHRHAERIEALDDAVETIRARKAKVCHVTQAKVT